MAKQLIKFGDYANDGTGDDLRTAFKKVKENFDDLYGSINIDDGLNLVADGNNAAGIFAQRNTESLNLEFKTLTSTDNTVTITPHSTTVNLKANTSLHTDTNPSLGGNLNQNGFTIGGGNITSTVNGYNVSILNALVELLLQSNAFSIELGSIMVPAGTSSANLFGYDLDMGAITGPQISNLLDFGSI
jgi:hypothetical protein